jgi:hypothetical protein
MLIHAIPDVQVPWSVLVAREQATGQIPLPAVDSLTFDQGSPPVIALLGPEIIPGALHLFVDTTAMSAADQVILDTQLQLLDRVAEHIGVKGELRMIAHAGGLDYDLVGDETIRLQDVDPADQANLWAILQTIALVGAKYPNKQAIVESYPESQERWSSDSVKSTSEDSTATRS